MYKKCFSTLRYSVDVHMGTSLCWNILFRWGWISGKMGYGQACMMLWCHGWGFKPTLTASYIYVGCIQSVLAPWDAVDGHMGTPLCRYYIVQVGVNFRENGVWPSHYDVVRSWLRLQTPIDCIPHPYWMYKKCYSTLLRCCGWADHGYTLMPEYIV